MATGRRSHLVGWLYADLLLVLLIAALSGMAVTSLAERDPESTVAANPSGTPEPAEPTLDRNPTTLSIPVDSSALLAGKNRVEAKFRKDFSRAFTQALELRKVELAEAKIGFDITFGYNPDLDVAQAVAKAANRQARRAEKRALKGATFKDYGNTSGLEDPDHVTFELYLLR